MYSLESHAYCMQTNCMELAIKGHSIYKLEYQLDMQIEVPDVIGVQVRFSNSSWPLCLHKTLPTFSLSDCQLLYINLMAHAMIGTIGLCFKLYTKSYTLLS